MIYSCTIFFNEDLLLQTKMEEEGSVVDQFIVAEATETFARNPREPELFTNSDLDMPWLTVVLVHNRFGNDFRENEAIQRNASEPIVLHDDDIVIVTDIDEIIPREDIPGIVEAARESGFVRISMDLFYFKINLKYGFGWRLPFAATGKYVRESGKTFDELRTPILPEQRTLATRGKHFSYLGSPEEVAEKIVNSHHQEFNKPEVVAIDGIRRRIQNREDPVARGNRAKGEIVEVDDSYPRSILDNLEAWRPHIAMPDPVV